jgi:hypothetical protein
MTALAMIGMVPMAIGSARVATKCSLGPAVIRGLVLPPASILPLRFS